MPVGDAGQSQRRRRSIPTDGGSHWEGSRGKSPLVGEAGRGEGEGGASACHGPGKDRILYVQTK